MRYALILAGGSGTRLWPLSREAEPKQLVPLLGGRSLVEEAWERLEGLVPPGRRLVCGAERHRAAFARRIPELGGGAPAGSLFDRYIGEPMGRDTLPALALSAALVLREDPEAVLAVFTSDHLIRPREAFARLADRAFRLVEADPALLVTYGVRPDRAATGFGYLELGGEVAEAGLRRGEAPTRLVHRFREKPDGAAAAAFLAAGPERYLWNSGMFAWRADRFLGLVGRYEPGLRLAIEALAAEAGGPRFGAALAEAYPGLAKKSVDYGVMEPASRDPEVRIAALPLEMEWRDIGSWPAFGDLLPRDEAGNASLGEAVFAESSGSLAVSSEEGHLVACLGCEDLVVIHTADATLVCPRSRAEELKKLHALVAGRDGGRWT